MRTFRLILWPSVLTMIVSTARLVGEQQGWATAASGGRGFWLGISWLPFVFGPLFAFFLRRAGSRPRVAPVWPIALLAFGAMAATIGWQFGPMIGMPRDEATFDMLRPAVLTIAGVTITLAAVLTWAWPRLAWALLCYALPARLYVLALTWFCKHMGLSTHYTKFGPPGLEADMSTTMLSAGVAQLGFWVPFTIVAGFLFGGLFAKRNAAA